MYNPIDHLLYLPEQNREADLLKILSFLWPQAPYLPRGPGTLSTLKTHTHTPLPKNPATQQLRNPAKQSFSFQTRPALQHLQSHLTSPHNTILAPHLHNRPTKTLAHNNHHHHHPSPFTLHIRPTPSYPTPPLPIPSRSPQHTEYTQYTQYTQHTQPTPTPGPLPHLAWPSSHSNIAHSSVSDSKTVRRDSTE